MSDDEYVPTPKELSEAGITIREGNDPQSRGYDALERFRKVPNHAIFLFTSEDRLLPEYLRNHWDALDGLSGDDCDIHVSVLQLRGGEDAYSQLNDIRSIRGLDGILPVDLPALHLWSKSASVTLSLSELDNEGELRRFLRAIFTLVQNANGPIIEKDVVQLAATHVPKVGKGQPTTMEIYMQPKYSISGGQQGAVGDDASASDFTQVWSSASSQINLPALAEELADFYSKLSKIAVVPDHQVSLGEIAAAQVAAREGDGPKALLHLKKAGKWVWSAATNIGIGVAVAAAKTHLGL